MDKTIAILIPCYNEALTIKKVINDWQDALPNANIYVYDNNSIDNTVFIAQQEGAIVKKEKKQGKGYVVRRMFREIDADVYIMVDGDDTYPSNVGMQMVQKILDGADMVIGDRLSTTYKQENKRIFHNFGNDLVKNLIKFLFKCDITDAMTGLRAFSRKFVKTFPVLSDGFQVETEMSIHAADKRLEVVSIPIVYQDRIKGSNSKLQTIPDGIKVLKMICSMLRDYRPMLFFGLIGVFLILIAGGFFIPILIEYINTGLVPKFPTLIVSGCMGIAGLQSIFTGAILQTLRKKELRDFEINYINR